MPNLFRRAPGPSALAPAGVRLGEAAPRRRGDFVALVPGALAPVFSLDLPPRVSGPARLAIARRQLVDRLGSTAETLELHPLGTGRAPWTRLVAVAPDTAREWRADPLLSDRRCRALVPDYLALPGAEGHAVISASDGIVRVRLGLSDGFTAPAELAATLLAPALAEAAISHVVTSGDLPGDLSALLGTYATAEATALAPALPDIDLRRGPEAEASGLARNLLAWTLPLGLAAAAAIVAAVQITAQTAELRRETAAIRAETTELLRQGLIPSAPILDIEAQVSRRMAELSVAPDGPGPLDVLHAAAVSLDASDARVQSVTFDGGGMTLVVRAPDFAAVEAATAGLREAGLPASANRARATSDGTVEADLDIAMLEEGR